MTNLISISLASALGLAGYLFLHAQTHRTLALRAAGAPLNGIELPDGGYTWRVGAEIFNRSDVPAGQVKVRTPPGSNALVVYHHAQSSLTFSLPASWHGYSVLNQQWEGQTYVAAMDKRAVTEQGPLIVLRHPQWKEDDHYQDIPILLLTRSQFEALHQGKFSIGAGGVEIEIAHNDQYVFAVSSRFNADDSVKGWKEATEAVESYWTNNATHLYPQ